MKQLITRQEMEAFARILETAKNNQLLSVEEFSALHAKFRAQDAAGGIWTVGIHTTKWHRLDQGKWTPASPPESLSLEEQLVAALQKLSLPAAGTDATKQNAEQLAVSCGQCGSLIKTGKKFCPGCGTPVSAPLTAGERSCPYCGQTVPIQKKFCTGCGRAF
jgi:RNA polymerase subunit RPABC4/transcription elongation factor Spt4